MNDLRDVFMTKEEQAAAGLGGEEAERRSVAYGLQLRDLILQAYEFAEGKSMAQGPLLDALDDVDKWICRCPEDTEGPHIGPCPLEGLRDPNVEKK